MTTIVYHDGIIAADSRITQGDIIVDDSNNKILLINGIIFAYAGFKDDIHNLSKAYRGDEYDGKNTDINAIVADGLQVFSTGFTDDGIFWKNKLDRKTHCIGSGRWHAWTAIDCGCNAKQAVKMAIKRDIYSGGKVRTYAVKKAKK